MHRTHMKNAGKHNADKDRISFVLVYVAFFSDEYVVRTN